MPVKCLLDGDELKRPLARSGGFNGPWQRSHGGARRKKKRKASTRPGKGRWRAPDLVSRDFSAGKVNKKWFGDDTEIRTAEGKLYLSVTWNPSVAGSVGRRPSSPARIPT